VRSQVSFTYPGRATQQLSDVNVRVALSSRIAVLGANGAGKVRSCAAPVQSANRRVYKSTSTCSCSASSMRPGWHPCPSLQGSSLSIAIVPSVSPLQLCRKHSWVANATNVLMVL